MDSVTASLIPRGILDERNVGLASVIDRLDDVPMSALDQLYDPTVCQEGALPFLARQLGVYDMEWVLAATPAARRRLVQNAIALQKLRGTPWALKRALEVVGWPGLVIQERTSTWASFKVTQPLCGKPMTDADLALLLPTIEAWKPARCILDSIELGVTFESSVSGKGPRHDGTYHHDGAIKYEGLVLDTIDHLKVGHTTPSVLIPIADIQHLQTQKIIHFKVTTGQANGLDIDAYSIHTAADTLIAAASAPTVTKTSAVSLDVVWTLNIV
jgi:phage tail P2-like protein